MTIRTCLCLEVLREVGRRCSSFLILGILNLVLFREQDRPLLTDKEFVKVLQEASKKNQGSNESTAGDIMMLFLLLQRSNHQSTLSLGCIYSNHDVTIATLTQL